jgi:addiction module RelE/StbE family toxin
LEIKVIYTEEFKRDLRKVKDNKIQARIKKTIQKVKDDPEAGKPLKYELSGLRSIRIQPFRILYELRNDVIILHKFDHRETVYR